MWCELRKFISVYFYVVEFDITTLASYIVLVGAFHFVAICSLAKYGNIIDR